jgi:hypothetical protein
LWCWLTYPFVESAKYQRDFIDVKLSGSRKLDVYVFVMKQGWSFFFGEI